MSMEPKTIEDWKRYIKFHKEHNAMVVGVLLTDLEALVDRAERRGDK